MGASKRRSAISLRSLPRFAHLDSRYRWREATIQSSLDCSHRPSFASPGQPPLPPTGCASMPSVYRPIPLYRLRSLPCIQLALRIRYRAMLLSVGSCSLFMAISTISIPTTSFLAVVVANVTQYDAGLASVHHPNFFLLLRMLDLSCPFPVLRGISWP